MEDFLPRKPSKEQEVDSALSRKLATLDGLAANTRAAEQKLFQSSVDLSNAAKENALLQNRTSGERVTDLGINLTKSALSIGETVAGTANLLSGGFIEDATNILEGFGRVNELLDSGKSDKLLYQEARLAKNIERKEQERDIAFDQIEGSASVVDHVQDFLGRALDGGSEVLKNPAALLSMGTESSLSFVAPAGVAGFVRKKIEKSITEAAKSGKLYASIGKEITGEARKAAELQIRNQAKQMANKKASLAALGSIAAIEGSSNAVQVANEINQYTEKNAENIAFLMENSPIYRERIAKGEDHEEIVRDLSNNGFINTFLLSGAAAGLISKFTGTDKLLGNLLDKQGLGKILGDTLKGTLNEGAEEFGQSAAGQLASNVAIKGTINENQKLDAGVASQAGIGAVVGAVTGGTTSGTVSTANTAVSKAANIVDGVQQDKELTDAVIATVKANKVKDLINTPVENKSAVVTRLLDSRVASKVFTKNQEPQVIKDYINTTSILANEETERLDKAAKEILSKPDANPAERKAILAQATAANKNQASVGILVTSYQQNANASLIKDLKEGKKANGISTQEAYAVFGSDPTVFDDKTLANLGKSIKASSNLSAEARADLTILYKARKAINELNRTGNGSIPKTSKVILEGGKLNGENWRGAAYYYDSAKGAALQGKTESFNKSLEELTRFTDTHTKKSQLARAAYDAYNKFGSTSAEYTSAIAAYRNHTKGLTGEAYIDGRSGGLVATMEKEAAALKGVLDETRIISEKLKTSDILEVADLSAVNNDNLAKAPVTNPNQSTVIDLPEEEAPISAESNSTNETVIDVPAEEVDSEDDITFPAPGTPQEEYNKAVTKLKSIRDNIAATGGVPTEKQGNAIDVLRNVIRNTKRELEEAAFSETNTKNTTVINVEGDNPATTETVIDAPVDSVEETPAAESTVEEEEAVDTTAFREIKDVFLNRLSPLTASGKAAIAPARILAKKGNSYLRQYSAPFMDIARENTKGFIQKYFKNIDENTSPANRLAATTEFLANEATFREAFKKVVKVAESDAFRRVEVFRKSPTLLFTEDNKNYSDNFISAVYGATVEMLNNDKRIMKVLDDPTVNSILGRHEDHPVTEAERAFIEEAGDNKELAAEDIGKNTLRILGLKADKGNSASFQSRLESSIGNLAMTFLANQKLVKLTNVSSAVLNDLTGSDTKTYDSTFSITFYQVDKTKADVHTNPIDAAPNLLGEMFNLKSKAKAPSLKPYSSVSSKNNRGKGLPEETRAKMLKASNYANTFNDAGHTFVKFSTETQDRLTGVVVDRSKMPANKVGSIENGKNTGLVREVDNLLDFYKTTEQGTKPFYLKVVAWTHRRFGYESSIFNPQTSKLHRALSGLADFKRTVNGQNTAQMLSYKSSILDKLGYKTNNMKLKDIAPVFDEVYNSELYKTASDAYARASTEETVSAEDENTIIEFAEKYGANADGLYVLSELAKYNPDGEFESTLRVDADGTTNGVVIGIGLMGINGANFFELMAAGGFYVDPNMSFDEWITQEGNKDIYSKVSEAWTKVLGDSFPEYLDNMIGSSEFVSSPDGYASVPGVVKYFRAVFKLSRKEIHPALISLKESITNVFSFDRSAGKLPTTMFGFGAGLGTAATDAVTYHIDEMYEKLIRVPTSREEMTEFNEYVDKVNQFYRDFTDVAPDFNYFPYVTFKNKKAIVKPKLLPKNTEFRMRVAMKAIYELSLQAPANEVLGTFIYNRESMNKMAITLSKGYIASYYKIYFNALIQKLGSNKASAAEQKYIRDNKIDTVSPRSLAEAVELVATMNSNINNGIVTDLSTSRVEKIKEQVEKIGVFRNFDLLNSVEGEGVDLYKSIKGVSSATEDASIATKIGMLRSVLGGTQTKIGNKADSLEALKNLHKVIAASPKSFVKSTYGAEYTAAKKGSTNPTPYTFISALSSTLEAAGSNPNLTESELALLDQIQEGVDTYSFASNRVTQNSKGEIENKVTRSLSLAGTGRSRTLSALGVGLPVMSIHNIDGATTLDTISHSPATNQHDSNGHSVVTAREGVINTNKTILNLLKDVKNNPYHRMYNMFTEALNNPEYTSLLQEAISTFDGVPYDATDSVLEEIKNEAQAINTSLLNNRAKFDQIKSVDQYFLHNAAYKVDGDTPPLKPKGKTEEEQVESLVDTGLKDIQRALDKQNQLDLFGSTSSQGTFNTSSTQAVDTNNVLNLYDQLEMADPRGVSTQHSQHLKGVVNTLIQNVMKPINVAIDNTSDVTMGRFHARDRPLIEIALGTATGANTSFLSAPEVYVHELLHHISHHLLDGKGDAVTLKKIRKLFMAAERNITAEDFYPNPNPTASEKEEAQKLYEYIFRNTKAFKQNKELAVNGVTLEQNRNHYLHEFFAFGLTNEKLMKALAKPEITEAMNSTDLSRIEPSKYKGINIFVNAANHLLSILGDMLSAFEAKRLGIQGLNGNETLLILAQKLVNTQNDNLTRLSKSAKFINTVNSKALGALSDYVRAPLAKLFPEGKVLGKDVPVVTPALDLVLNKTGLTLESTASVLNEWSRRMGIAKNGFTKSIAREMLGNTSKNAVFTAMLRYSSNYVERERANASLQATKAIQSKYGSILTAEEKDAVYYSLLKSDAGVLLRSNAGNFKQVYDVITNQAARDRAIASTERDLRAITNDTNTLAYYKAQARSLASLNSEGVALLAAGRTLNNAHNIARAVNNSHVTVNNAEDVQPIIDRLITLYTLNTSSNKANAEKIKEIYRKELKAGKSETDNGLLFTMEMYNLHKEKSKKENFFDQESLMIKGYVKEETNPNVALAIAATPEDKADLIRKNYKEVTQLPPDPATGSTESVTLMVNDVGGLRKYMSGIFSLTSLQSKGTGLSNEANAAVQTEADRLNQAHDYTLTPSHLTTVGDYTYSSPVYRYSGTEYVKKNVMQMNTHFDEVLGNMFGAIIDKNNSAMINSKAIDLLVDDFDANYARESTEFTLLTGDEEFYRLLPSDTRRLLESKFNIAALGGIPVREGLIPLVFGQRKLTIGQWADNKLQNSEKSLVNAIGRGMALLGNNSTILKAEVIWQDIMKLIKDIIVVKSGFVLMGNILSNFIVNTVEGISLAKQTKWSMEGTRAVLDYKELRNTLGKLELELQANKRLTSSERLNIKSRISRIEEEIAKNPVKDLIDEGVLQAIIEDVEMEENNFTYLSGLDKLTDPIVSRTPEIIKSVTSQLFITHDTKTYKVLRDATQLSDFVARYALYKHKQETGMEKAEAINYVVETFVNYDLPTHAALQYANDMGFVMFSKFFLRIQKVILRQLVDKPVNVLATLWAQQLLSYDAPDIMDTAFSTSGVTNRSSLLPLGHLDNLLQIPAMEASLTPR